MVVKNIADLHYLTEGGEGTIYENGNSTVVKIYKPSIDLASKQRKIQLLMGKRLPKEVVGPLEEVFDKNNKFIGFTMPRVLGTDMMKLSSRKYVKSNNVKLLDVIAMLANTASVLKELHSDGIVIGDLNDQNILFDDRYNIKFIDCDSWAIDNEKCLVAMDSFRDPLLVGSNFDAQTDNYSFAIIAWKSLTRIHPYGGTTDPDMSLLDRMKKGISVIDNPKIKIPKTVGSWKILSPDLINAMKEIFENRSRKSIEGELQEMIASIKWCSVHQQYYYGKYQTCPLCDDSAQVLTKPVSNGVATGLQIVAILVEDNVDVVLNDKLYMNKSGNVVHINTNKEIQFTKGNKYYFTDRGIPIIDSRDTIEINSTHTFEKKFNSNVVVHGEKMYYMNRKGSLMEVTISSIGNNIRKLQDCNNNSYFDVSEEGSTCILNIFDNLIIANIDGYNFNIKHNKGIINYGLHYDKSSDSWLVVIEDNSGAFRTIVLSRDDTSRPVYDDDRIKYQCPLSNLAHSNKTIFIPIDGAIRGYSYSKNVFKDFECSVVNEDSKLIRADKKFIIVNDENIYRFG